MYIKEIETNFKLFIYYLIDLKIEKKSNFSLISTIIKD